MYGTYFWTKLWHKFCPLMHFLIIWVGQSRWNWNSQFISFVNCALMSVLLKWSLFSLSWDLSCSHWLHWNKALYCTWPLYPFSDYELVSGWLLRFKLIELLICRVHMGNTIWVPAVHHTHPCLKRHYLCSDFVACFSKHRTAPNQKPWRPLHSLPSTSTNKSRNSFFLPNTYLMNLYTYIYVYI